jgi:uncharacterized RDD family membrane protein YckC
MNWYYALEGAQHGPATEDEIRALIGAGKLSSADMVWREGMTDWKPLSETPELMSLQSTAGPPAAATTPAVSTPDAVSPYQTPASQLGQEQYTQADFLGYAGFWQRFAASFIDSLVLMVVGLVVGVAFGLMMVAAGSDDPVILEALGNLIGLLLGWIYYALMESSSKQATLGKMALGIKVTDLDGNRIGFGKATGRHFGKIVSALILCIGYLMMLWSPRKQTLHDVMAGCLVTRSR